MVPAKMLQLLEAAEDQARPKVLIEEYLANSPRYIENIFGIYDLRGIADNFRE